MSRVMGAMKFRPGTGSLIAVTRKCRIQQADLSGGPHTHSLHLSICLSVRRSVREIHMCIIPYVHIHTNVTNICIHIHIYIYTYIYICTCDTLWITELPLALSSSFRPRTKSCLSDKAPDASLYLSPSAILSLSLCLYLYLYLSIYQSINLSIYLYRY